MGHHLVLVPCPLQGHMNPMLHMAKLLHTRGFNITIIMFTLDLINTSNYPEFFFQCIDGISQELSSGTSFGDDVLRYLNELNENCEKPFRDYLQSKLTVQSSSSSSSAAKFCIIYDAVMYFSAAVADEFEIPRIVLRTSSASTFLALSLDLNQKDVVDREFPELRDKDKPVFASNDNISNKVLSRIHHGTRTASAVIWNSLHCLESTMFKKVKDKISSPIFPICPSLHHKQQKDSSSFSKSSQPEDQSCISWLETKASKSVLYVSTGSLVRVTKSELLEMAWGLANSGQSFLWVVRPGLVNHDALEVLPKEFEEATRKRGKVVRWAPQKKVLGHRSIGGFWTHNGWNSTVESVSEGVPMICWPRVGDQRVNARVVSHVWKVGIELEEKFGRWEVERAIRRIMVDEEEREMRKRAIELKEKVRLSLEQGGSSFDHLGKLVNYLFGYNYH